MKSVKMGGDQIQLEDEALFVELTNLYVSK